jgi:transcriptional regulator with XRE-family HTH domain
MAKRENRVYSRYVLEAIYLLGTAIRVKRIERQMTAQDLADRAGVSRGLLRRIEQADPNCSLGVVFEVASILGIPLFHADYDELVFHRKNMDEKLVLLPREVRQSKIEVKDDF